MDVKCVVVSNGAVEVFNLEDIMNETIPVSFGFLYNSDFIRRLWRTESVNKVVKIFELE